MSGKKSILRGGPMNTCDKKIIIFYMLGFSFFTQPVHGMWDCFRQMCCGFCGERSPVRSDRAVCREDFEWNEEFLKRASRSFKSYRGYARGAKKEEDISRVQRSKLPSVHLGSNVLFCLVRLHKNFQEKNFPGICQNLSDLNRYAEEDLGEFEDEQEKKIYYMKILDFLGDESKRQMPKTYARIAHIVNSIVSIANLLIKLGFPIVVKIYDDNQDLKDWEQIVVGGTDTILALNVLFFTKFLWIFIPPSRFLSTIDPFTWEEIQKVEGFFEEHRVSWEHIGRDLGILDECSALLEQVRREIGDDDDGDVVSFELEEEEFGRRRGGEEDGEEEEGDDEEFD